MQQARSSLCKGEKSRGMAKKELQARLGTCLQQPCSCRRGDEGDRERREKKARAVGTRTDWGC